MSVEVQAVPSTLNYFTPPTDGTKPYAHINADPATGIRKRNWEFSVITKNIENVRGSEDQYTLDSAGFQFFKAPTQLSADEFENEQTVQGTYYDEQAELVKKLTGASKVVIFDHTIRRNLPGRLDDSPDSRTPVATVHVDQTPAATVARIHRHLPASEAPSRLSKRYQIINLWRPIRAPAFDRPLALCDFRSVDLQNDCVPSTLRYPDRDGETWAVKYNEEHKWKYLKGMTPEELVLIKCMDSITDGSVALYTPHTAFTDPTTPADAKPRESIELRALVFYD